MRARPSDAGERTTDKAAAAEADRPEAAIGCRAENRGMRTKQGKCRMQLKLHHFRDVASDEKHWPSMAAKCPAHPHAEIATPLRYETGAGGQHPYPPIACRSVWRHADFNAPGSVRDDPASPSQGGPVESERCRIADAGSQTRFDPAEDRQAREHNDCRSHRRPR